MTTRSVNFATPDLTPLHRTVSPLDRYRRRTGRRQRGRCEQNGGSAFASVGIPAELHVYAKGEHDFGVRQKGQPTGAWTEACVAWLRGLGVLKPGRVPAAGG